MKNESAGVKNGVPTSDHLDVLGHHDEHHDEHHKVGNRDPDNTPRHYTRNKHLLHS